MIVLLNVKATAIYKETITENPNNLLIKKPIKEVKIIWPIPATKETLPTSFMTLGLKLIPTMKRSSATPICENTTIVSVELTILRK